MHTKDIRTAGRPLDKAQKALILLHGRGAPAEDILGLAQHLPVDRYAVIAPQATQFTWYPQSFLAARAQNEPWLSSALALLDDIVVDIRKAGIPHKRIFFSGFSQGACLALEYVARNARRWGGVAAFTGGLIGDTVDETIYSGDFEGTPVFIGTGDPDTHVPLERVHESVRILKGLKASVSLKIYPGIGHTILADEVGEAGEWVFREKTLEPEN